jgi:hypothetical protein
VAIAMANLDRLPDQPEIQQVHEDIRAHLIAAMGQTIELAKRAQIPSSTSITSSRSRRVSKHPSHQQPSNPRNGPPSVNPLGGGGGGNGGGGGGGGDGGHSGGDSDGAHGGGLVIGITTAITAVIGIRK